jgi:hypothetical protein
MTSLMVRNMKTCNIIKYTVPRFISCETFTSDRKESNDDLNKYIPSCKNCVYYIPKNTIMNKENYSKCSKFRRIGMYSGYVIYDSAKMCREDIYRCTELGKSFVPVLADPNKMREFLLEKVF